MSGNVAYAVLAQPNGNVVGQGTGNIQGSVSVNFIVLEPDGSMAGEGFATAEFSYGDTSDSILSAVKAAVVALMATDGVTVSQVHIITGGSV